MGIQEAELHQVADIGAARFAKITQKAFLDRKRAAGDVGGYLCFEFSRELVTTADKLLGRHAGSHPMGV